jgi:hypothetical protein
MNFDIRLHQYVMKRIPLIFLLTFTFSCSLMKELEMSDVVGEYEYSDRISYYSTVQLKADSTFNFNSGVGLSSSVSSGKWSVKGRRVILNSFQKKHEKGYVLIHSVGGELSDSITLNIVDVNGDELPFSKIRFVDGSTNKTIILDFNSSITILKSDYDSIYVRPFYCPEMGVSVKELNSESITIQFDQGLVYYHYFLNEKWRFKNNRLYNGWFMKNKFQKQNYYKRVDTLSPVISI